MDPREVDVSHVIGAVVVLDLAAGPRAVSLSEWGREREKEGLPVEALDFDGLAVFNRGCGGDWMSVSWRSLVGCCPYLSGLGGRTVWMPSVLFLLATRSPNE